MPLAPPCRPFRLSKRATDLLSDSAKQELTLLPGLPKLASLAHEFVKRAVLPNLVQTEEGSAGPVGRLVTHWSWHDSLQAGEEKKVRL
jgi:hypothetical protein